MGGAGLSPHLEPPEAALSCTCRHRVPVSSFLHLGICTAHWAPCHLPPTLIESQVTPSLYPKTLLPSGTGLGPQPPALHLGLTPIPRAPSSRTATEPLPSVTCLTPTLAAQTGNSTWLSSQECPPWSSVRPRTWPGCPCVPQSGEPTAPILHGSPQANLIYHWPRMSNFITKHSPG